MTPGHVTISITIAAPLDAVWDELERIEDHVDWMADAESIEFHTDQRRGIGTTFTCRTKIGPLRTSDVMTIDAWDDHRAIGVTHAGAVTGTGRFTLDAPSTTTTVVTWDEQLTFPWYFGGALGAFAATPVFRWIWSRNLVRLRARVTT